MAIKETLILFGFILLACALVTESGKSRRKERGSEVRRVQEIVAARNNEISAQDNTRCQTLYDSFIPLRDAAVDFIDVYPDGRPYLQYVQMSLNFPVSSDSRWRSLMCNVAAASNFRQLGRALNIMIPPKQLYEIADHFKQVIFELEEELPAYVRYNTDMREWLNKTGFPDRWPLDNTNEQEVVTLMREGQFGDQRNLILLGADPRNLELENIAEILLDCESVNEYVIRLGSEWLVANNHDMLETNMNWLRLMADGDKMDLYYDTLFKLFEFTRTLDELGILQMI